LLATCETSIHKLMDSVVDSDPDLEGESELDLSLIKVALLRSSQKVVATLQVVRAQLVTMEEEDKEDDKSLRQLSKGSMDLSTVKVTVPKSSSNNNNKKELLRPFSAYIQSDCSIDLCVAIDYTGSNGDPRESGSLHYLLDENSLNDYEEVIQTVGDALVSYSHSKEFVVWGFGAKFDGEVRHIFQCGDKPTAEGVDGILEAYRSVFKSDLIMSGPTVYDQVLQAAAMKARAYHSIGSQERFHYKVLLIITDGIAVNIEETKRKAIVYSQFPFSVIVVGVGRADFSELYSINNLPNCRQNVTFVEFRQHQHDGVSLARAALERLPQQIVAYMNQIQRIVDMNNSSSSLLSVSSDVLE